MRAIATRTAVEVLHVAPETGRAGEVLRALAGAASDVHETDTYTGDAAWLVLWGPGEPSRVALTTRHVAAGGHVIACDLAYWNRQQKFRISIDAAHPQAWVMARPHRADRFDADPVPVAETWDPTGPILIAGIGRKALVQYGQAVTDWEAAAIATCRQAWPHCPVLYRPKQIDGAVPAGAMRAPSGDIDRVLAGCSMVITWHSNVAIDAIRLGIPVVCRDGAAAAVCPGVLPFNPHPLQKAVRDQFLANLAYFQWAPSEAVDCWAFLREVLA